MSDITKKVLFLVEVLEDTEKLLEGSVVEVIQIKDENTYVGIHSSEFGSYCVTIDKNKCKIKDEHETLKKICFVQLLKQFLKF